MQSADNYEKFEKEFLEVLNKHAPSKKKLVRTSHVPYKTKAVCKATMKQPYFESKYLRNSTVENKIKYKNQKDYYSKSCKGEHIIFYSNSNIEKHHRSHSFLENYEIFSQ